MNPKLDARLVDMRHALAAAISECGEPNEIYEVIHTLATMLTLILKDLSVKSGQNPDDEMLFGTDVMGREFGLTIARAGDRPMLARLKEIAENPDSTMHVQGTPEALADAREIISDGMSGNAPSTKTVQ